MNTPWGKSDNTIKIARGLSWVDTPGHGGFMVADGYARKHLSASALLRGERYGNYYAYEEDCNWAIVALEVGSYAKPFVVELAGLGTFSRESLLQSLSLLARRLPS